MRDLESTQHDTVIAELFASDRHKHEQERQLQSLRNERLLTAMRDLMASDNGKLLLFELINATGVFAGSFTGNSHTFYLEGKRAVGLFLYQLIMTADPHALQKLVDFAREQARSGQ